MPSPVLGVDTSERTSARDTSQRAQGLRSVCWRRWNSRAGSEVAAAHRVFSRELRGV